MNVLSLCDFTTRMVEPFARAGATCVCIDIQHDAVIPRPEKVGSGSVFKVKADLLAPHKAVSDIISATGWDFIFAFPPCTHLAVSGARWFQIKGLDALIEALQLVNACRKICEGAGCPWFLENPVSTLSSYWRKPDYYFHPSDYAGYLDDPSPEAYSKKTSLWTGGGFIMPPKKPVNPVLGSKMHKLPPSEDRANLRSETPRGFARAVFEANWPKEMQNVA